ncbi:cell division protein FtsW [Candidatus Phycorickettsia trachydisci]|uniref:Probable peptidoglycan glycosyltransferase FtsW n=1 Tax=Candidatus Phycorickettsia trachydisci TaxID=2115978 RepID=A0A2P1P9F6_9RICK|nr:cell division protein FtsW [Candidatus Phycorickettsia trachydisci]
MRRIFYKLNYFLSNWWQSVDQVILWSLALLFCFGMILVTAASPAIAGRIGIDKSFFIIRQGIYLSLAAAVIIFISMASPITIRRFAILGFCMSIILLLAVKFFGYEIKGAKRWINLLGISIQPSEFTKPFFFILTGWILSVKFEQESFPSVRVTSIFYLIIALFLITQPDIGTLILISASYLVQLFIAGMPIAIIALLMLFSSCGLLLAYNFLPHVASRINTFLGSDISNNYQITKSLLAYEKGGIFGLGPAEGIVKYSLPDSHTDFIFAVAGEEFGVIACITISLIFCIIAVRSLLLISRKNDYYIMLSGLGLVTQFVLQAMINMSVTLNLIPTKGMTLPFISYGGSSILAMAISMGVILSFTRRGPKLYTYKFS